MHKHNAYTCTLYECTCIDSIEGVVVCVSGVIVVGGEAQESMWSNPQS